MISLRKHSNNHTFVVRTCDTSPDFNLPNTYAAHTVVACTAAEAIKGLLFGKSSSVKVHSVVECLPNSFAATSENVAKIVAKWTGRVIVSGCIDKV